MKTAYRRRTALKGERGYVLVMSALLMLPLLAFAGFAVDIGSWYMYANRMQRAADAAALAGVVWMPNDEKAEQVALEAAKANGFDDAASDIVVSVVPVGNRRLRVNITDTNVDMYFSRIFLSSVDIQRQALAEYVQAIPMGSPDNILGNDPDRWNVAGYTRPYYWLNVAGPNAEKQQGDRYTANDCNSTFSGCTASTSSGQNLDYSDSGYFYRLSVDSRPASGNLTIDAFDPAFTAVGAQCSSTQSTNLISTSASNYATMISNLQGKGLSDAATRYTYSTGTTDRYFCSGDTSYGGSDMQTSYIVRAPDNTPFDNFDNPIICGKTFGAYNSNVYDLLMSDTVVLPENMLYRNHFRKWTTLCTIPWSSITVGDYLVQVTSTASQTTPPSSLGTYDPAIDTGGYNKFSLRAGFGTPNSAGYASGVNIFADGRLPIYVNEAPTTGTSFYLARIVPEYAGQMLELELFDIGDGSPGDVTVVAPTDMTGSGIANCTFIRDGSPPVVTTSATCTQTGLSAGAGYNGKVLTVQVPLPDNYSCNAGSDTGCWFKISIVFSSSAVTDQTTWSARVRGDPVRIVE